MYATIIILNNPLLFESLLLRCAYTSIHCVVKVVEIESLNKLENGNFVSMCLFKQFFRPVFLNNGQFDSASYWLIPIMWADSLLLDVFI